MKVEEFEVEKSLNSLFPEIASQWHYEKNAPLTPKIITCGSGKKVWWRCEKGHEWESTVSHRTQGRRCPYCVGRKVCHDNCLMKTHPHLIEEWYYEKNYPLTPSQITHGSSKKVWWRCEKGHEWEAAIYSRVNGNRCPCCYSRKVCKDNCLLTFNPELATQWHPSKNGSLTPQDVMPYSNIKIWWVCQKGHEWESSICARQNGNGCPYCSNQKIDGNNCLAATDSPIIKEWHPTRNGDLTPWDVAPNTDKKIWWICEKGHEWQANVSSRNTGGRKCPKCQSSEPQIILFNVVKELFTGNSVDMNYKHNEIRFSKSGWRMELDVYVPEINLAFEYQGEGHYFPIYGERKLEKCKIRDAEKKLACEEIGITLIEIDYTWDRTKEYVISILNKYGYYFVEKEKVAC